MPLCYRARGEDRWRFGTSANMSRSGLLFVGDHRLDPQTPIEVSFQLPTMAATACGAQVMCQGQIARTAAVPPDGGRVALAATIAAYRLVRVAVVE